MNSVSIWQDKIILHWDRQIPPGADPRAIREAEDVIHFWPNLKGFCRYSKRAGNFILDFSKQNMKRLHKEFGQIPVKSGIERINELKAKQSLLYDTAQIAMKCKDLPVERLPEIQYKVPPLAEYQHRGVVFLCNVKRAPLFADCGMGKTWMVLTSTERQIQLGLIKPGKTLIAVKLNTIETGWLEDAEKFTNLKLQSLWLPPSKGRKDKIIELINTPADAYVINHDGLRIFEKELAEKQFDKVVVDESTILKGFHGLNPRIKGGQFGRALMAVAHKAEWRVIMSGTPAPNGPEDYWGQFYFLDPDGLILEPSFNDFRLEFMELLDLRPKNARYRTIDGEAVYVPMGPKTPKKWINKKDTIEKVSNLTKPFVYRLKLRDHLKDFPELTTIKRLIPMDAEQMRHYSDMKDKLKVVINDERIVAAVRVTQLQKLRQITGGFIIDHQETVQKLPKNPKLEELDSLLNEEIDKDLKVVIYCQYREEVETIADRYKAHGIVTVYGGNSATRNLANIKAFREDPKVRLVVLHPKSAAHGITFTIAHYMIFFSMDHSAEDNYQCIRRIERAGQKFPMFVYYLLGKGTVDEAIYTAVILKQKNQSALIDDDQMLIREFQAMEG